MWSNSFKAGNTIYRSQDTYSNFTLCDHIWLFVGKVHVAARDSVQSQFLQEWLCAHAYVIMAGSYGISTLHGITKLSAVQYSEEFYLILFPNTSLQDNLLHLTLLNQCFRQQSTSGTCGVHEKSRCCRGAPQILCTNCTQFLYTHTQKPYLQALNFLLFHSPWHIFLSRAPFVCLSWWAHTTPTKHNSLTVLGRNNF